MSKPEFELFRVQMHVYMPPGTSNEDMVYLIEKALCTGKKYGGVEWESLERTTATEDLKLNEEVGNGD